MSGLQSRAAATGRGAAALLFVPRQGESAAGDGVVDMAPASGMVARGRQGGLELEPKLGSLHAASETNEELSNLGPHDMQYLRPVRIVVSFADWSQ